MKSFNFDTLKSAVSQAVQTATATAKDLSKAVAQEVVGAKCLLDYTLQGQVASGGPGGLWKIYLARAKKEGAPYPLVSAWILDKRHVADELSHGAGAGGGSRQHAVARPSAKRLEMFLEQCRRDVQHLARLKHPSVVRLVAPLEETRTQLVFITEPMFASLENLLHGGQGLLPEVAAERRALKLSELETKHGLLQVCEGLHFLHSEVGMVHRALCPGNVYITHGGAWKLGGFGQAVSLDYSAPDLLLKAYDYSDPAPSLLVQVTQPPLPYTAPELVAASAGSRVTASADVFSLAALAYEALCRTSQLLPVGFNLAEYESRVSSMAMHDLAGCPLGLEQTLRQMLAPAPQARPPAIAFASCQYFQGDVQLRALKFLDSLLQRDTLQKAAFLKDLPALCGQFDTRVLRLKVLPPLLGELRSEDLQPLLLPIVLRLVEVQDATEFSDVTLPALRPLLASAKGEALLLLTKHTGLLQRAAPRAAAATLVPALLVRAAEHGDVRCQEEMLRQVGALAESLEYEGLKTQVLPAVHALCLNTTAAAVRVGAFAAMGKAVGRADATEAAAMLQVITQVTAVDKTAATTMCALALGDALGRQFGARVAAERVLPALCPLLVVPSLSAQQAASAMKVVRDMLARVEKARGADGTSPTAAGARGQAGAALGGPKAAEGGSPAASDWLAATSTVQGFTHSHSPKAAAGTAGAAGTAASPRGAAAAAGSLGGWGGLAAPTAAAPAAAPGWQQQQQQQRVPLANGSSVATASAPSRPAAPSASLSVGSTAGSGVAGLGMGAASSAADPFAWPPPQQAAPQQQQQQAQQAQHAPGMGPGMRSMGGPGMRSSAGGGGAAAVADPFAGLQLSPAATGGSGIGSSSAALDPFDSLVLSGHPARQQPTAQQPARGGLGGVDSLI